MIENGETACYVNFQIALHTDFRFFSTELFQKRHRIADK